MTSQCVPWADAASTRVTHPVRTLPHTQNPPPPPLHSGLIASIGFRLLNILFPRVGRAADTDSDRTAAKINGVIGSDTEPLPGLPGLEKSSL